MVEAKLEVFKFMTNIFAKKKISFFTFIVHQRVLKDFMFTQKPNFR